MSFNSFPSTVRPLCASVAIALAATVSLPAQAAGTPYSGTAIAMPATIEAENFDKGGEGAGYHDLSSGNAGGQYRTAEAVDIIASTDAAGGNYVVNNFQTGEWMAYTVSVPAAGVYDIAVRASNNMANAGAFHIEVDGVNVTGSVAVPKTGGWDVFNWFGKTGITLPAGQHVLKLVADTQYFNVNSLRVQAGATPSVPSASGTPYSGTPIAVPLAFEAENFDKGGEGRGYHDLSTGNSGSVYRTSEGVDLIASNDALGGGYVVNNFQTGEWLAYTINVPAAGLYDLSIRASNNGSTGAYHFEVDGVDVSGRMSVANTGGWDSFAWVGKPNVQLSAGKHVLKLVSDAQYFNVNSLSVLATVTAGAGGSGGSGGTGGTGGTTGGSTGIPSTGVAWSCDMENNNCGMTEQSALESSGGKRSSFVSTSRSGSAAIRLHTEPGDNNIHGSGTWERNDVMMSPASSYCSQGQEEWWGHSVMFPSDYVFPPGPEAGIIFDFHHNASSGQANFEIGTIPGVGIRLRGYGGSSINSGQYNAVVPDPYGAVNNVTRNKWYDFNYHVKWSSGSDGYMIGWLNGKKIINYNGPTLYSGISCYLKLANYHAPFGQASSVIHDRIVRGSSAAAVSVWTLE